MKALFIVLTLIFISCEKEEPEVAESNPIVGKWDWQRTTGGIGGIDIRKSEERQELLILRSGRTYEVSINGKLIRKGIYTMSRGNSFILGRESDVLHFSVEGIEGKIRNIYFLDENSLILQDDFVDGFTHEYTRW